MTKTSAMKFKVSILTALLSFAAFAYAQTGLESGTQYGKGEDSVKCLENYTLFSEYAKQKNYADAYDSWTYCFENCPAAGKGIYISGVKIVRWEIKNAKTTEEREEKIDKLMRVYDQRIKYFGNDPKRPEAIILGDKAVDLISLKRNDITAQKQAYDWLLQSINGLGKSVTPKIINHYMVLSFNFYTKDEISGERMLSDYEMIQSKLDIMQARGGEYASTSIKMKNSFEESLANSGAADCKTLEKLYSPKLEADPSNEEVLAKLLALFEKTDCTDSELYYKASETMHSIKPSSASAFGLAKMYIALDHTEKALGYYQEAVTLEIDDVKKSQYLYTLAFISFSKEKDLVKARQYALQAVGANPSWGEPYILVGKMYAQSAQDQQLGKKDIENQAGYWAAVDLFNKAKQVDDKCTTEADQYIKIYSNYFPSKEEIFFEPDYEAGKTVKVGGWIGKSTIVRSRD